ncbi:MAG: hypothetical protein H5T70_05375 [Chloroflexi bacterium]|nr:hypothetical protein [Chloroflexota bacterium]
MARAEAWSLRHIYLYIVCLITLIMVIVATVGLVRSLVDLLYPQPVTPVYVPAPVPTALPAEGETRPTLSPEEIAARQKEEFAIQRQWAIRSAVLSLVGNVAMLAIAGPLYAYHWRKIERERAASPSEPPAQA